MVSVILLSYNQKTFIANAIKSVLNQKTNFKFEILVFDDGSTDGTQQIIQEFETSFKNIKSFLSKNNEGNEKNGAKLLNLNLKKYIAFIDGDDLWINENKLQNQIDFLENNQDYIGCFHDAKIKDLIKSGEYQPKKHFKLYSQMFRYNSDYYIWNAIDRIIIPNSTVIYKSKFMDFKKIQKLKKYKLSGNWMMSLFILLNGKLKYINEPWSVYNDHSAGITKKRKSSNFNFNNIMFFKELIKDTEFKSYKKHLYFAVAKEYKNILYSNKELSNSERIKLSLQYLQYSFRAIFKEANYLIKDNNEK